MTQDPTPEARALVEKWWKRPNSVPHWQDLAELALAIDEHTAAAVLAEREAIVAALPRGCHCMRENARSKPSRHEYHCSIVIAAAIRARTPPAGRGTR